MGKDDRLNGWVHWQEAMEWAKLSTDKGFIKEHRDWLDQMGVDYVHKPNGKQISFVNLAQLKEHVDLIAQKRAAGLCDSDIFEDFKRQ